MIKNFACRGTAGGFHSTGELGTRRAPVAAANCHGWVPGGAAVAGVCAPGEKFAFRGVGPDVSCAGAALRCHPVGTPAEPTPQVSWALGGPRWPPPIAAAGSLGALPRPGCAHNRQATGARPPQRKILPALPPEHRIRPSERTPRPRQRPQEPHRGDWRRLPALPECPAHLWSGFRRCTDGVTP